MTLRISRICCVHGVGPTLCHPIKNSNSDGPYKYKQFCRPRVSHHYNKDIRFADTNRLVREAKSILESQGQLTKRMSKEFVTRCASCAHLFTPVEAAVVLKALSDTFSDPNGNITTRTISNLLLSSHRKISGVCLVTLIELCCKKQPLLNHALEIFCNKVPETLHELSIIHILKILSHLRSIKHKNYTLCHRTHHKVSQLVPLMDGKMLASTSTLLGFHELRSMSMFDIIESRATDIGPKYFLSHPNELFALLMGFISVSLDAPRFIPCLPHGFSKIFKTKKQKEIVEQYIGTYC